MVWYNTWRAHHISASNLLRCSTLWMRSQNGKSLTDLHGQRRVSHCVWPQTLPMWSVLSRPLSAPRPGSLGSPEADMQAADLEPLSSHQLRAIRFTSRWLKNIRKKSECWHLLMFFYFFFFSNESALMDTWLQWEMTCSTAWSASRCRHYSLINDRVYSDYIHFITINNMWETLLFSCKYSLLRPHLSRT